MKKINASRLSLIQRSLVYLDSFVSYEGVAKIPYSEKTFDLQRVKDFLLAYGVDYGRLKYIHVAGSKGKGTTCAFIANFLWRDGYKVGLYTSPHIFEVTERIWLNGVNIEDGRFTEMVMDLKGFMDVNECPRLTYFEVLTVLALKYFVDEGVDYAVLEVGLGGRLDATNIVRPVLSILTNVELEHTDVLGDTIEKIASEKLGIAKEGVPILVGKCGALKKTVKQKLGSKKDVFFAQDFAVNFSEKDFLDFARYENARVAFAALKLFLKKVDEKKFLKVVQKVRLLGRFDVRKVTGGRVIFDMAHTKNSVANLVEALRKKFPGQKFVFLFALMKGKNVRSIFRIIAKVAEKIIFTNAHEARGIPAEELAKAAVELGLKCGVEVMEDSETAFAVLTKKNRLLVVTGSHFLVGKLIKP